MTNKEKYEWCKQNHICVRCHKEKAEEGNLFCLICKKKKFEYDKTYKKEMYEWCKENHICINCNKEKAEKGSLYCLVCKMDKREKNKEYNKLRKTEKQKEDARIHNARRYDALVAFGICPSCSKRKHKEGSIFCERCSAKRNDKAMKKRREKDITARVLFGTEGYCSTCGKQTEFGQKLCNRCLENSRRSMKIAQKKALEEENYFRRTQSFFFKNKGVRS